MEAYIRHFVSQHLGKAIATVEWCGDDAGQVHIALPQLSPTSVDYAFVCAQMSQLGPERAQWAETLARIAIHQTHKQFLLRGQAGLFGPAQALAADTTPWMGDLAPVPYGGATDGYARRGA